MTAIMGFIINSNWMEMATIIADDSTASTNGHAAYQDCRCVIVQEGFR